MILKKLLLIGFMALSTSNALARSQEQSNTELNDASSVGFEASEISGSVSLTEHCKSGLCYLETIDSEGVEKFLVSEETARKAGLDAQKASEAGVNIATVPQEEYDEIVKDRNPERFHYQPSMAAVHKYGWWQSWGKCTTGIVGGGLLGGLEFGPIGAVGGGLLAASQSCD